MVPEFDSGRLKKDSEFGVWGLSGSRANKGLGFRDARLWI